MDIIERKQWIMFERYSETQNYKKSLWLRVDVHQITTKFSRTYSKIRICNQFFLIINTPPIWIRVIKHSDCKNKKKIGKSKNKKKLYK